MADIRSNIAEISIQNFKFFPKLEKPISVNGNHMLMYGENGAGKSSIYWALYTLLESANKEDEDEIKKYFNADNKERLLNIHIIPNTPEWVDSFLKIKLVDGTEYEISYTKTDINKNEEAQENNFASDFINYRILFKMTDFSHSEDNDVFPLFEREVLPYVKFKPVKYWKKKKDGSIVDLETESANRIYQFVKKGPLRNIKNIQNYNRYPTRKEQQFRDYTNIVNGFKSGLNDLVTFINTEGNPILQDELGYDLTFNLILDNKKFLYRNRGKGKNILITENKFQNSSFRKNDFYKEPFRLTPQNFEPPEFQIWLSIPDYEGKIDVIEKPHSFLNEAKLTAIGLAIRLSILKYRLFNNVGNTNTNVSPIKKQEAKLRLLCLDDLLISLDMSNRQKVLELIFNNYIDKYQIFILTHDKMFFEYVKLFISQKSPLGKWKINELYEGKDDVTGNSYPILIDSEFDSFEKAEKYFKAKDYTTCALYIRKELEKLVIERLTDDFKVSIDGKYRDLSFLWEKCISRYEKLNHPFSNLIKDGFQQTKLMLLNPQAHHNLSHPVYKLELEKAFKLIQDIKTGYPLPTATILLSKGMKLQFKHPSQNYTFDFELLSDFYTDGLNGSNTTVLPKCKILTWEFDGKQFWIIHENKILETDKINKLLLRTDKLNKIIENLKKDSTLAITDEMFLDNTKLTNGIWTLKEIIYKSGAVI